MYLSMLFHTAERPPVVTVNYGVSFNRREAVVDHKSVMLPKVMSSGIALQLFLRSLWGCYILSRSWWGWKEGFWDVWNQVSRCGVGEGGLCDHHLYHGGAKYENNTSAPAKPPSPPISINRVPPFSGNYINSTRSRESGGTDKSLPTPHFSCGRRIIQKLYQNSTVQPAGFSRWGGFPQRGRQRRGVFGGCEAQ